ncbi:MAG: hypothetical protein ACR2LI_07480 [Propionibacteriaceae bacterium]
MPDRPAVSGASATLRTVLVLVTLLTTGVAATGCASSAPPPTPAVIRSTPPPWDVPVDGVSSIAAAGLEPQPLDLTTNQHQVQLSISIDGQPVSLAPQIGVDVKRGVQAPVHTHDASGTVWLEGRDADQITLGQFFTVWGVRFTDTCLGAACGVVLVTTQPALDVTDPRALALASVQNVAVTVRSG